MSLAQGTGGRHATAFRRTEHSGRCRIVWCVCCCRINVKRAARKLRRAEDRRQERSTE